MHTSGVQVGGYALLMGKPLNAVTRAEAQRLLSRDARAVDKLVDAELIGVVGVVGRTRLLSRDDVSDLAGRPPAGVSVERAGPMFGAAVSLGGLELDTDPDHLRYVLGWSDQREVPSSAWAGLWNTGRPWADRLVGLSLVGTVSGFVVAVAAITGWMAHPRSHAIEFTVGPPDGATSELVLGRALRFPRGPAWRVLYGPAPTAP